LGIAEVLGCFMPPLPHPPVGIDPTALVADGVSLGAETAIGPRVLIQRDVTIGPRTKIHAGAVIAMETKIGEDCVIWPNVVIRERCRIGNRVVIHPNATIGADGFGYNFDETRFRKIPHIGTVRIEDDVEIGANSCIDRGKCAETVIGRGTKIDNLVQIAHNVRVGENCCLAAHVGIAGSTELADYVTLAGKVGVKDNIRIGSRVQVAACSCIAGDIEDGQIMLGVPAKPKNEFFREHLAVRRLPKALADIRDLLKRMERLEATNNQKIS
jgi:UDP-3-O-[3-hydroxymyristoyl] glucosamine N-acyltransferase